VSFPAGNNRILARLHADGLDTSELQCNTRAREPIGARPPGEDVAETLAAVVKEQPDLKGVPPRVRPILERCLEEDPAKRLRDISGVALLLDAPQPSIATSRLPVWTAATLVVALAGSLFGWWRAARQDGPAQPVVRLDVDLGSASGIVISPDGSRLAYSSEGRLFIRRLDELRATALPGTEGAAAPVFSPDSRWVAFFADGKLKKVPVEGGIPEVLCDATTPGAAAWGDDDAIIGTLGSSRVLSRVPAAGGTAEPLLRFDQSREESIYRSAEMLPGSRAMLFSSSRGLAQGGINIEALSIPDGTSKLLIEAASAPRYLNSGHLAYLKGSGLYVVPFDKDRLALKGQPVIVAENVTRFSVSRTGTLVYQDNPAGRGVLQWLDQAGGERPLATKPDLYFGVRVSPDGKQVAVTQSGNIWVYDAEGSGMRQLTFAGGNYPLWSPNGRYVLYTTRTGRASAWIRADGAGSPQTFLQGKTVQWLWSFSPDGRRLAYFELTPQNWFDIWTVDVTVDERGVHPGPPERLLDTPSVDERFPTFSPDGRWLAYASNELGAHDVWVRAFPDTGGRWRISTNGGVYPEWSRERPELFFRSLDNKIMVVPYGTKGDSFEAGTPRVWSDRPLLDIGPFDRIYDLAPDGRVVALVPAGTQAAPRVTFVFGFLDEVRRLAPVE
jgi:serine/threonine-protein kinase